MHGTLYLGDRTSQVDELQLSRVQFTRNTIASSPSRAAYLLDLQYQRLSFVALDFTDNCCREADATLALRTNRNGQYDDVVSCGHGCIVM